MFRDTRLTGVEQTPTLDWTGDINFTSDGINPDTGPGNSDFEFRVKYTDANNDIPVFIEVWVDMNDDGDYNDSGEKLGMTESNVTDNNYVDGKSYKKTISLSRAGDNTLRYRFYASDGTDDAVGTPTLNSALTVLDPLEVPLEYSTIQAAITAAANGDYVIVSDGIYSENINFNNKAITVRSVNGAALTTIQGSGGGVTIENTTIGGSALAANSCGRGCAVYTTTSSYDITITGSTLTYNTTAQEGGAIYLTGVTGMTTITNSTISNNSAAKGSGIYSAGSPLSITNTNIDNNSAIFEGGGLRLNGAAANATIAGGSIDNNSATNGGGVYIELGADLTYTGGSISGNTANGSAGGIRNYGTLYIYSSTFAGNYSSGLGGGLHTTGTTAVTNSIFLGNAGGVGNPEIYGTTTVTYSDVQGGYTGTGNISLDPLFVLSNPATMSTPKITGDYHIQTGSPVVEQGTSLDAPADDIDGDTRPLGAGIDMGSDEKE